MKHRIGHGCTDEGHRTGRKCSRPALFADDGERRLAAYAELKNVLPAAQHPAGGLRKGKPTAGDGFVIARAAAKEGWKATVLLAEGEPKTPDAITNFERLHGLPVEIFTDGSGLSAEPFTAVVDALYGTGFHGSLRPSGLAALCADEPSA